MVRLETIEDFDRAINHPYRSGEFLFIASTGDVLSVNNRQNVEELIAEHDDLYYGIRWEGEPLVDNLGDLIEPVY